MLGQSSPTDPVAGFAAQLAEMRARIAELERLGGQIAADPGDLTGVTWGTNVDSGASWVRVTRAGGAWIYQARVTASGAIAAFATLFTLPAGSRPAVGHRAGFARNNTTATIGNAEVTTAGVVVMSPAMSASDFADISIVTF